MRRLLLSFTAAAFVCATATLSGCPAAHDDYPGTACKTNAECYQGELCNGTVCVPNLDMSFEGDFAHPSLDFSNGDALPTPVDMTPVDL